MELKNAGYGPVSTMTMGVLSLEVKRLIAWLIKYTRRGSLRVTANVTDASITDICTHSRRKTISKRTDLYGKKGESYRRNGASGLKKRTQKNAKNRSRNVNVWRKSDVESSKSVACIRKK
jgi:hypothetical protein